jgi:hypothetical protein
MSLEEIFAQAILTGGVTILNCSVVIGSNAQVSDFFAEYSCWYPKS